MCHGAKSIPVLLRFCFFRAASSVLWSLSITDRPKFTPASFLCFWRESASSALSCFSLVSRSKRCTKICCSQVFSPCDALRTSLIVLFERVMSAILVFATQLFAVYRSPFTFAFADLNCVRSSQSSRIKPPVLVTATKTHRQTDRQNLRQQTYFQWIIWRSSGEREGGNEDFQGLLSR